MSDEVYYIHRRNAVGRPLPPIPYRFHHCEHCGERQLVEHLIKSPRPKQGRCVFCGKQRLKKEQA